MTKTKFGIFLAALFFTFSWSQLGAQCTTFEQSGNKDDGETAHVLYRQAIKAEDYEKAYPNWKKAYEIAPAADGRRSTHYTDGVDIMKHYIGAEQDPAKRETYIAEMQKLYDQMAECYPKEASYAYGRKAYDLLYTINAQRDVIYTAANKAMDLGGNEFEYIAFYPLAESVVYLFSHDQLPKEDARAAYLKMMEVADHNIANNKEMASYYQKAKDDTHASFVAIEDHIFDCEYFKGKLLPEYQANKNDYDKIKTIYVKLIQQGCTKDDPDVKELADKYDAHIGAINAQRQAEFEANNPGVMANKMYKEGNYKGAAGKYKEAIAQETDNNKKATYLMSLASIQGRKLGNYATARTNAQKAAKLRSGWGKPYLLIGDLYAKGSKSCGDAFQQRLAILAAVDKWSYAKSIDPSVASEANRNIGNYKKHYPSKADAHMRGMAAGQSVKVKCWIGETVKLRVTN